MKTSSGWSDVGLVLTAEQIFSAPYSILQRMGSRCVLKK